MCVVVVGGGGEIALAVFGNYEIRLIFRQYTLFNLFTDF